MLDESVTKEELAAALTRGRIYAIKMYRERTGAGLRESKNAIEDELVRLDLGHRVTETCTYCNGTGIVTTSFAVYYGKESTTPRF